jgi:hypothetical protein
VVTPAGGRFVAWAEFLFGSAMSIAATSFTPGFWPAAGSRRWSSRAGWTPRTVSADSSGALGVYLSKLALEVSSGTTKTARQQASRTMWQVLRDGLDTGLADDLEAWEQYERASHGRKHVTFSRGLRRRYRLAEE